MEAIQQMIESLPKDLKAGLTAVENKLESTHASVDATARSLNNLDDWRSGIDTQVSDLSASMGELRKHVDRIAVGVGLSALGPAPPPGPGAASPPATPQGAAASVSSRAENSRPDGHRLQLDLRGQEIGKSNFPLSTPGTGTVEGSESMALVPLHDNTAVTVQKPAGPHPPAAEFPRFEGGNPRIWQKACEKYFHLFSVDRSYWVEYATMHFSGNAAMWLQRVEDKLPQLTWENLCDHISKQFDRGQYQLLYRQSFKLKQEGTVIEYVEKFDTLMHHMLSYKPDLDPTFFTTRFIEGLARDIKAVVMIQRPEDLETAVALTLLQEEIEEELPPKQIKPDIARTQLRSNFSAPTVSSRTGNSAEDKHGSLGSNIAALKNYRRAKGLCFTCGDKWGPTHKCSTTVPLHIVEELLAMLHLSDTENENGASDKEVFHDAKADHNEVLYSISKQAITGTEAPRSMRLLGSIQGHDVLILIDSGSSNNFISTHMANQLSGLKKLPSPIKVKVAGGGILKGETEIPNCQWKCQGNTFVTSLKGLSIGNA